MEMNVLYGYAYGKTGATALTPIWGIGTITTGAVNYGTQTGQFFSFPNTGIYSYMNVFRTYNNVVKLYTKQYQLYF
jgi:hypothetical protein